MGGKLEGAQIKPERVLINLIVNLFTIRKEKSCRPNGLVVLVTSVLASHFVAILLNGLLFHVQVVIGRDQKPV